MYFKPKNLFDLYLQQIVSFHLPENPIREPIGFETRELEVLKLNLNLKFLGF